MVVYTLIVILWGAASIWAGFFLYKKGLIDGIRLSKDKQIIPEKNPIRVVYDGVADIVAQKEEDETEKNFYEQITDIYGYQVPTKREGV